ncbi:hypothetical protein MY04_1194 [Flammeovirga sp. MY04]|uniref:hypothetical protein n=1 Tax=Flammeovirga sp. MY04 TaxID=1191459 RepID=UPI00080619BC|nr:hypothetical protein [Flammeovirga sp. MY04]ANQ48571.1 hypothetical protein MY04_1194 [Flammeovirga sp. MY04]
MSNIVEETKIIEKEIDNATLIYFETNFDPFKSALLFSNAMRTKLIEKYGSPLYAVLPVRDFCYVFKESDKDYLLNRLGEVVKKEYEKSGYPLTKEVFKITYSDIKTIGSYD